MNAIRVQGLTFSTVAILVTIASLTFARPSQQTELAVLSVLIIALGVPHGALDTIFARQLYDVKTAKGWLGFVALYLALATVIVGLWLLAPLLFLAGFILISIAHFSGDLAAGTPMLSRIFYGGAVIVLPTLLHADEVTRLFSFLVVGDAAHHMVSLLKFIAVPWALGLAIAVLFNLSKNWLTCIEAAAVGLLSILAPPLVAFTIFFCGMHSARHIMRTYIYAGRSSLYLLIAFALGPMLAVMIISFAAWNYLHDMPLDARIIQIIFIGLAALTVPHMALVEQVRISGWVKSAGHG
jgi:beta-carotene 15,15'-dioxygenase